MFPVRYELNFYILFRRNSVFKGLILFVGIIAIYSENHTKPVNTQCEQTAEFFMKSIYCCVVGTSDST
jgi:hypothetical protein